MVGESAPSCTRVERKDKLQYMTKRAILLGSILSLSIGLILPVTEFLIQGTRLGLSSATPAAFFHLFVIERSQKLRKPEIARFGESLILTIPPLFIAELAGGLSERARQHLFHSGIVHCEISLAGSSRACC